VWQKARILAARIYQTSGQFPRSETLWPNFPNQTSGSLCGFEYCRGAGAIDLWKNPALPGQARGSLLELDTQLAIALDLKYFNADDYEPLDRELYQVLGLLNRLIDSLRRKSGQEPKQKTKRPTVNSETLKL